MDARLVSKVLTDCALYAPLSTANLLIEIMGFKNSSNYVHARVCLREREQIWQLFVHKGNK